MFILKGGCIPQTWNSRLKSVFVQHFEDSLQCILVSIISTIKQSPVNLIIAPLKVTFFFWLLLRCSLWLWFSAVLPCYTYDFLVFILFRFIVLLESKARYLSDLETSKPISLQIILSCFSLLCLFQNYNYIMIASLCPVLLLKVFFSITVDTLYQFQVYNIAVRHLYNIQTDSPDKSSTYLTPYIVITVLLIIFPVLYFTGSCFVIYYLWICPYPL